MSAMRPTAPPPPPGIARAFRACDEALTYYGAPDLDLLLDALGYDDAHDRTHAAAGYHPYASWWGAHSHPAGPDSAIYRELAPGEDAEVDALAPGEDAEVDALAASHALAHALAERIRPEA